MNFKKLKDKFSSHAKDIISENKSNSKFRARSYDKVASVIEKKQDLTSKVTKTNINDLPITDHMKNKALEFAGFIKNKRVSKNRSRSKTRESKRPIVTKKSRSSRSRSRSKDRSTKSSTKSSTNTQEEKKISSAKRQQLVKELTGFMGLGEERANALIDAGLTKINQIHMKKYLSTLPEETRLWLELKPSKEIPHDDIKALAPYINELKNRNRDLQIVGSYRRGKSVSRDIDVMIISDRENAIDKFVVDIKEKLNGKAYPYSKGKDKLSIILDVTELLNKSKSTIYKLDAFRVDKENKIPMLLYSTGSKIHNIKMRAKAKKLKMLLNQKGLFKKQKNGEVIKVKNLNTEEDYFEALDMKYKEPYERE